MVAVGCGPQYSGSRYVAETDATPSNGGTLTVTDSTNALNGVTLTIPPGALATNQHITLEMGDAIASTNSIAGPAALFGPSGLVFSSPATMTLPIHDGIDTSHLFILGQEEDGTRFKVTHQGVTVSGNKVSFGVHGFTTFQPGLGTACVADSDCDTGLVCTNGACALPQGSCTTDSQCAQGQRCMSGSCQNVACTNDAQCAQGEQCDVTTGTCRIRSSLCTTDSQCPSGDVCVNGGCEPVDQQNDGGFTCAVDSDCGVGAVCVNGICEGVQQKPDAGTDGGQGPHDGGQGPNDGGQGPSDGGQGPSDGGQGPSDGGLACFADSDCPSGQVCADSICVDAGGCTGGTLCGSACVDLTSDSNNCGACGVVCSSTQRCAQSACH
jgi:Cys-rich repeat protein